MLMRITVLSRQKLCQMSQDSPAFEYQFERKSEVNKELRTLVAQELRATGSDKQPRIEGYAATFSGIADLGGFKEKIAPGAFTRTLADGDEVVFLVDHNPSAILGRLSAGTLRLQQDSKGLRFEVDLPPTTVAADAHANLKAGN